VSSGDVALDRAAEAFTGVFIHNGHDLDRSAVGGGVELEVHRPDLVRGVSLGHVGRGGGAESFAAAPLRHAQAFYAPQPLDLLVVHGPAFAAGVVIRRAEPASWMVFRVLAQPLPQPCIGVGHSRARRLSSLRCSVLPGDPAGEPFADLHRGDEVRNGRPPAFRA
jgi:hypothetical protein